MTRLHRTLGAVLLTITTAALFSATSIADAQPEHAMDQEQAAAKNQAAKDQAARYKAANDRAIANDPAAKDPAAKDTAAKDTAAKDKALNDKASDKAAKDWATSKDKAAKDKAALKNKAASNDDAKKQLSSWSAGPRLAGLEMIDKYGAPQEITDDRMIWHDAGPFKRILLTREELPHHFPIVHMDYLEHTISYDVPADKASELLAFDGAISIYRVGGELSARCDLESNNVLTLNLAHAIIEGKKNVQQARKEFGDAIMARTVAENPAITAELQFKPQSHDVAAATDTVSIPGAPKPADTKGKPEGPDGETLALLIASDMDEVHAAMIAKDKKVSDPILNYARMLHEAHGKHIKATVDVGMSSNVTPIVTKNVGELHDKHAAALSEIVLLDGDAFGRAYMDLMVKAHTNAQNLIDKRLAMTTNEEVKNHLTATRETITMHLEQAKALQGEVAQTASR